jgi:hypothetical protein
VIWRRYYFPWVSALIGVASRPCRRCVSLDKRDSCIDVQHKRRGRPRLRESVPSVPSLQSDPRQSPYLHRHVSDDAWQYSPPPSYSRDALRRNYPPPAHQQFHGHNRSFSQGSTSNRPLHYPYPHPTPPPNPAYTHSLGPSRNSSSGFDAPNSSRPYPYQTPSSPTYYSHRTGPAPRDSGNAPHPAYPSPTPQINELRPPGPPNHHQRLLPAPEDTRVRGRNRRGSHQSEDAPRREEQGASAPVGGGEEPVTLPSLKDLGVPFR